MVGGEETVKSKKDSDDVLDMYQANSIRHNLTTSSPGTDLDVSRHPNAGII